MPRAYERAEKILEQLAEVRRNIQTLNEQLQQVSTSNVIDFPTV